jgi:hypothetical protein
MKKAILLFALMGSLGFLAGCAVENQKTISSDHLNKVEAGELYTNQEYGFTLTFSDSWKGFTAEKRVLNWGELGLSDSVDFGFGPENSLFNVAIHSKDQWKKIAAEQDLESRYAQIYLEENENFVFSFASTNDVANQEMSERLLEVRDIIKTFQMVSTQKSAKAVGFVSDLSFEYPAALTYSGGGDMDTGSFSWLNGIDANGKEFTSVRIFDHALIKCKFTDPALCEIGAWGPATSEEVYKQKIEEYKKDNSFSYGEQVKTANTIGEKFVKNSRLEENGEDVKAVVVIKSKSGVFIFQQIESSASEFDEIIRSVKVHF